LVLKYTKRTGEDRSYAWGKNIKKGPVDFGSVGNVSTKKKVKWGYCWDGNLILKSDGDGPSNG